MPCNSSEGMGDAYREDPEARRKIERLVSENHKLTAMLCSLLRRLNDDVLNMPEDVVKWFEEHKAWDRSQGRG